MHDRSEGIKGRDMRPQKIAHVFLALLSILAVLPTLSAQVNAQTVELRKGDRLELSVPQREELRRVLTVDERGMVFIPIVGDIMLEGVSIQDARTIILRRVREIYPSVQDLTLTLVGEEARRLIYVHGEVRNPGSFEFDENPDLWEAIRDAGGATSIAALENVRVITTEEGARRTHVINLQNAIESGDFSSLPILKPGDTVIIPAKSMTHQETGSVRVLGAVAAPTSYTLTGAKTLRDAIIAAGGPTELADLRKVAIIRRTEEGTTLTMQYDFKRYLEYGDARQNPLVYPNDTVHVPGRSTTWMVFSDPRFYLSMITALASLTAIVVALQN
jgi:protein involved in polysaccharide export with SLBB domain